MKMLLVMRHGKSDWKTEVGGDHERPLAPRGERASERMGRLLTAAGLAPDLVVASTAVRARTTAELAYGAGGWSCPLATEAYLYEASVDGALDVARATDDAHDRLLLVGHEPTSSSLVASLCGGTVVMVTAAVACLELGVRHWRDLRPGAGQLLWLAPPRLIGKARR